MDVKPHERLKVHSTKARTMIRDLYYLKAMGYDFINEDLKNNFSIQGFKELQNSVKNCTLCHFSKTRKYALMEEKQKNVKLLILGSFAQKSENESGILLDSSRGENLQKILQEILGLGREDFYFSYLFKCFSHLKFDDFSLQSCLPFFWNEFKLIKPKLVLCLGEYAFKSLGFGDFNALRGEIFACEDFFILPSFELEFIEKNPSYKEKFIDDLKKLKGFL